jgi:NAD(P) transhydrogenase
VTESQYDIVVIGSGPAGQKAAVQAAKAGSRVALIERDKMLGGACVHRGTIPSKTLRENALRVRNMRQNAELANFELGEDIELATLITRLDHVLRAHDQYMQEQIDRNLITRIHGRARFTDARNLDITQVNGASLSVNANNIVIATGSLPRHPDTIPIDHEHIFDSDSILSMMYLPKSLTVLGGGVIASEYASIFQALGVTVTMIDSYPRPLGFLDADLSQTFINGFEHMGGTWMGNTTLKNVYWDGLTHVVVECENGDLVKSEKLLCAAGRIANTQDLALENAGLSLNEQGLLDVDDNLCTAVSGIYAAGDVIGPPSLASASMEQGRRASCNALQLSVGSMSSTLPSGIYGIPELSAIGLTEAAAREAHGEILVGKADFSEIARGHISGIEDGMLKIVCAPDGMQILGVMIAGEGATELIHIGQMAMLAEADVDIFVESTFNFPTLAEAYRVAALAIIGQRAEHRDSF